MGATRSRWDVPAVGNPELALLYELWQTSHFGWLAEATVQRNLLVGGHDGLRAALAELLAALNRLGWLERRQGETGRGEWRLTAAGRRVVTGAR